MRRRHEAGPGATVAGTFICGALAGAAIALLMAPADGRTTRRAIGRKVSDGKRRVKQAADDARDVLARQRKRLIKAVG